MAEHNVAKSQPRKRTYVNIPVEDRKVRFHLSELEQTIPDIKGQIVARDFKLIEQNDMVVAYIPQRDSRPELSVGVINELAYARQCTINTYVIWPSNKNPSPFLQAESSEMSKIFVLLLTRNSYRCINSKVIYAPTLPYLTPDYGQRSETILWLSLRLLVAKKELESYSIANPFAEFTLMKPKAVNGVKRSFFGRCPFARLRASANPSE